MLEVDLINALSDWGVCTLKYVNGTVEQIFSKITLLNCGHHRKTTDLKF